MHTKTNPQAQILINSIICRVIVFFVMVSAVLLSTSSIHADTLAYWNMDGSGATKTNVNTVGSGVTVSPIGTTGLNAIGSSQMTIAPSDNYAAISRMVGANDTPALAADFSDNAYFSFTITPTLGSVAITNISFYCMAATANTAANREFFLESDATGYGTTSANVLLGAGTQSALNPGGGINWSSTLVPFQNASQEVLFSVDLSENEAFADLTGPVTFRFYIGTDTVSQNLGFDDLTVSGIAPVPEPSTFALLGLSGFVLLAASRRRRA